MDGTRFGIVGAIDQTLDSSMDHRPRTHGARLNCSKQFAVSETVVANPCTCLAQGEDFGMSRRIAVGDVAVPSAAYDLPVARHDRAYRDFAGFEGALGATESFLHQEFVRGQPGLLLGGH